MSDDVMRFFAAWMLTHEVADEGLKAAVLRGSGQVQGGMVADGPDAFVDGLAAMVAQRKEALKAELAAGSVAAATADEQKVVFDELRFEVAEMRGRIDEVQGTLETILAKLEATGPARG